MTNARAIRKAKGLRQKEAAAAIGCTSAELSRLESGKVDPKLSTLRRVARGLGVTVAQLVDNPERFEKDVR